MLNRLHQCFRIKILALITGSLKDMINTSVFLSRYTILYKHTRWNYPIDSARYNNLRKILFEEYSEKNYWYVQSIAFYFTKRTLGIFTA